MAEVGLKYACFATSSTSRNDIYFEIPYNVTRHSSNDRYEVLTF